MATKGKEGNGHNDAHYCDSRLGTRVRWGRLLSLQRYLMKDLVKALFPMREIGAVMTLLHGSQQLQDLIRIKDFERQHDCQ
jgi:hypothetical protein